METTKTDQYLLGMRAINNFYAMLYKAMREALPEAQLSKSGAYVWRGYQVNQYKELAPNQYYCEVYPGDPLQFEVDNGCIAAFNCRELVFQESYQEYAHRPIDEFEHKLGIKTGNYHYPFRISLDLYRSRFFLFDLAEQYEILINFIAYAANQALVWQRSDLRTRLTNEKFLHGQATEVSMAPTSEFDRVPIDFLSVWQQQNTLFDLVESLLQENVPSILGKNVEWIRRNRNRSNFDFRGLRLKLKDDGNDGASDYLWAIYYEQPEVLGCYTMEDKKVINTYNLISNTFFDLNEEQQKQSLVDFIDRTLRI